MITKASAVSCPWVDKDNDAIAHLLDDAIYIACPPGVNMDLANMQLSLFSVDGLEFSLVPPKGAGSYWKVCSLQAGRISAENTRMTEDPARGSTVQVRPLTARPPAEEPAMPAACGMTMTWEGAAAEEAFVIWQQPAPEPVEETKPKVSEEAAAAGEEGDGMEADGAAAPADAEGVEIERAPSDPPPPRPRPPSKEHSMFLPYGSYTLDATCEIHKSHPVSMPGIILSKESSKSIGFVIPRREETDAKSALISLAWGRGAGKDSAAGNLELCLAMGTGGSIEGLVNTESLGQPTKGGIKGAQSVTLAANPDEGFGPKVINVTQPVSGKYKLYVTDNAASDPKVFLKCNPVVNIWFFNGLFKSFRPSVTREMLEGGSDEGTGKTWYVCDLRFETDQKMGKECVECVDQNKIIDQPTPSFGSD